LRQLRDNLTADPLPAAVWDEIAAILSPAEQDLFGHFTPADQRHSYRVLRTLRDAGYNEPDLLAAALLHDIGKVREPLSAWDRTIIVVGEALFPGRAEAWGRGSLRSWRRPFVARARHPAWGAEMASAAGSRPRVVELIRRHQARPDGPAADEFERFLSILQWADDQN
jgi:putative nucleotidyltransferase with HDIG domain